ncbi:MAG: hypothetical protein MRY57_03535 [Candidatus Pacebacteria bacterium]|nr:hypothetical protein [Candidatus Paceibacterota bacterium]
MNIIENTHYYDHDEVAGSIGYPDRHWINRFIDKSLVHAFDPEQKKLIFTDGEEWKQVLGEEAYSYSNQARSLFLQFTSNNYLHQKFVNILERYTEKEHEKLIFYDYVIDEEGYQEIKQRLRQPFDASKKIQQVFGNILPKRRAKKKKQQQK